MLVLVYKRKHKPLLQDIRCLMARPALCWMFSNVNVIAVINLCGIIHVTAFIWLKYRDLSYKLHIAYEWLRLDTERSQVLGASPWKHSWKLHMKKKKQVPLAVRWQCQLLMCHATEGLSAACTLCHKLSQCVNTGSSYDVSLRGRVNTKAALTSYSLWNVVLLKNRKK